ncbi:MAG: purine-binding chemotaxis protein CheW [Oscillospiraceae bacterium]|nr:purine-binding chemotaxis protein CheW [Oscillospiraceae bacterium]
MSEAIYTAENKKTFAADGIEILFFTIGDKTYGIEIKYVNEIIGIEQITVVPKIPDYIKGVINIRGKVVPVISVRKRFGMEEIPYDDRTCIIVLEFENGTQVGVIVDRVQEVVVVDKATVSKVPDCKNVNANKYIKSIINSADDIKLLLDCDKLIMSET